MNAMLNELGRDLRSEKLIPALSCGTITGVQLLVFSVSMAAVIFSGPLNPFLAGGLGLVLFGYCALGTLVALASGFRGAVAGAPLPSVMMLVAITTTIDLDGRSLYVTSVAAALIGTMAAGLGFLVIGRLRLARFLRFIPYPVSGGFIAGTGGLACLVAFRLMGIDFEPGDLFTPPDPDVALNLGIGLVYGLGLFVLMKFWKSFVVFPASFLVAASAFQLALPVFGISGEGARAAGLVFSASSGGELWPPIGLSDLQYIDWNELAGQIPNLLILFTVTLVCVVMNLGGLEVTANVDLDWNREFRVTGWANAVTGAGGAPPGCLIATTSIRNVLFGATTRLTGLFTALALAACLIAGDALLSLFPVPLIGGVLLFLGLHMMEAWLFGTVKRLGWTDYLIILVMFATIVGFGFLEGVAIGMLITTVIFVISLSRMDLVQSRFTMRDRQSNRTRPVPERAILLAEGSHVQAYRLRGYLFFGSAYRFADQLKLSLNADPSPSCILLDFGNVTSFDFSAVNAMVRFIRAADTEGVVVVLAGASERFEAALEAELPPAVHANLVSERDEDHALERCEEVLIEKWQSRQESERRSRDALLERVVDDFARHLDRQVLFEALLDDLGQWMEPREYVAGETIVGSGQPRDGLQFLHEGRASQFDSNGDRLQQFSPGDVIEPRGAFDTSPALSATIAVEPCRTLVLSPDARAGLERSQPQRMLELYGYLLTADATAAGTIPE